MTLKKFPISTLLPRDARDALVAAAAVDSKALAGMSVVRTRELEAAIERVKQHYPIYFQQEKEA